MKVQKVQAKQEFKPFRLIIDIENIDEAKELWCRFNICYNLIIEGNKEYKNKINFESSHNIKIFNIIDDALEN